jgi:ParB/RepB/Spo0J family partition protein
MEIVNKKIEELIPFEGNPRQATEKEFEDLKKSIQKFGIVDPIIVNKRSQRIVGGHFRVKVAKSMGITEVPVIYVDLDDEAEKELNYRLNANHGSFNFDMLVNYDQDLLKDWGFNFNDLNVNIDKIAEAEEKELKHQKPTKCPNCNFEFYE